MNWPQIPHGVIRGRIFISMEERLTFNTNTRFWPKMCHKLPHRTAGQVRNRIKVLFDPAILKGHSKLAYKKPHQWTMSDTEKLLKYYKIYGMSASAIKKIGELMKLPMHTCQNHLRNILERTGPVPNYLLKKLWVVVTKQTSFESGCAFDRVVSKAIRKCRLEVN
ncbi:hypothetical protein OSTOST_25854, partial [Ostertagia ostertagi]